MINDDESLIKMYFELDIYLLGCTTWDIIGVICWVSENFMDIEWDVQQTM